MGYSEPVLRLFPTICSVLSILLLAHVAGRFGRRTPQLIAVAVLAVSFYPIRHGAEIKPYASDLLVALILLALAFEWMRYAGIEPVVVGTDSPGADSGRAFLSRRFRCGGVSLAHRARGSEVEAAAPVGSGYLAYNLFLVASFVAVYFASTVFQAEAMRNDYRNGCWADAFPPLDRPWAVPLWLVDVHAGTMMSYPVGERHGGSDIDSALRACRQPGGMYRSRQQLWPF